MTSMLSRRRARALPVALCGALSLGGCHRKHVPVTAVPEIPYPACGVGPLPNGTVLTTVQLRAGRSSLEQTVQERFELRARACLVVATVHQDWPLEATDLEVIYDARGVPLRAWRRSSLPGSTRPGGTSDTRRYELRTPEVTVKRQGTDGVVSYEILRGGHPRVILGPGRGLITVWLQRARLPVGGRVRELTLDLRGALETLQDVTLVRKPDQVVPALGRRVRVYTVYGRESVFADDHDVVLGDLAGMVPSDTPGLPPLPTPPAVAPPDPIHTP